MWPSNPPNGGGGRSESDSSIGIIKLLGSTDRKFTKMKCSEGKSEQFRFALIQF